MFKDNLLAGRRILVTGGGTGLGKAMAARFLQLGADVDICGRRKIVCDETATELMDLYGGRVSYHGRIAGLGMGTGSAFALLPAQNATGNWIKVVQRVPVRIRLDRSELEANPLQVGLSMEATIDTRVNQG